MSITWSLVKEEQDIGSLLSLIKRLHIDQSCKLFCLIVVSYQTASYRQYMDYFSCSCLLSSNQCLSVVVLVCSHQDKRLKCSWFLSRIYGACFAMFAWTRILLFVLIMSNLDFPLLLQNTQRSSKNHMLLALLVNERNSHKSSYLKTMTAYYGLCQSSI